ncbi:hypothetical protein [Clostridium porci]|uniref:Uncharacterized protein n=1 Tax=Clostridium porci TaxID=2605778 RepID=A0A7X2NKM9_9CLOT|nr:hypothetical protein [Clostridium porci]MSS36543.1 hypothetical protein [Clostridium porci]
MYVLDQSGEHTIKTEDFIRISLVDETQEWKREHPATKGQLFVVRAYQEIDNRGTSFAVAKYCDEDEAKRVFLEMVRAIGTNAELFSFYPLEENIMQERDIQGDLSLEE